MTTYKYARWSGSAWVVTNIVAAGKRFNVPSGDPEPYFGSVHIPGAHRAVSSTSPVNPVGRGPSSVGPPPTRERRGRRPCSDRSPNILGRTLCEPSRSRRRLVPCRARLRADVPLEHVRGVSIRLRRLPRAGRTVGQGPDRHDVHTRPHRQRQARHPLQRAITVTVPTNAAVAFPVGASIDLLQLGAGQITVSPAGGVTVNKSMATAKSRTQYSVLTLNKIATDTWVLSGDAAAS